MQNVGEVGSFDVGHRDKELAVLLAEVKNMDDVLVVQFFHRLGFQVETLDCFFIGSYFDDCTCFFCDCSCSCNDISVNLITQFLWSVCYEVHAHLSAAIHPCICHVVSYVTYEYDFAVSERFCNVFFDCEQVSQDLSRVINVSQTIPYRNACILSQVFNDFLVISSVFDTIVESSENLSSIFQGFFLAHL